MHQGPKLKLQIYHNPQWIKSNQSRKTMKFKLQAFKKNKKNIKNRWL